MKKILNGLNIAYRYKKGESDKTVLLLHGWGGNLNSFRALEQDLIQANYSVVTLDFPGFGGSDLPNEDWTLDDYVKVVEELINVEQLQNVCVVAHSFGGRVAIKLCATKQNMVQKLVLVDSAGIKPKFSLKKCIKIWHYKLVKKLVKAKILKKNLSKYGSEDYKAMPKELKSVFNKIVNTNLNQDSKKIVIPTLLIWGKDDKDTPLYMAKKLNKNIKDSAIITLNGGHFAYLNNTNKFSVIIKSFLEQ